MLTGQESIQDLLKRDTIIRNVLRDFGITTKIVAHLKLKNLAHAAVVLKKPLRQILLALSEVTGEKIQEPFVTGMEKAAKKTGLRKGAPSTIKKVIAVHSGKGGVGKTFVAVNLAVFLADSGHKVGLLDADIDCPNVMKMLRMEGKLVANADKKIVPLQKSWLKVVSMAPLQTHEDQAIMWRGPVISKVIEQFIQDTDWGALDYLIVDLPPGTGDAPITVLNILPSCEVLIVTMPQELSLIDAQKAVNMAQSMRVPVVGLIENMCGEIFGGGRKNSLARLMAKKMGIAFLGSIDLKNTYVRAVEQGKTPVLADQKLKKFFSSVAHSFSGFVPKHKVQ